MQWQREIHLLFYITVLKTVEMVSIIEQDFKVRDYEICKFAINDDILYFAPLCC
jgi:hypothetical protein